MILSFENGGAGMACTKGDYLLECVEILYRYSFFAGRLPSKEELERFVNENNKLGHRATTSLDTAARVAFCNYELFKKAFHLKFKKP